MCACHTPEVHGIVSDKHQGPDMQSIKRWWLEGLSTPDKARTRLSNIAVALGGIGFALVLYAVFVAR